MPGRLLFITRNGVEHAPYAEITLPALARAGWEITKAAPDADRSILSKHFPFPHRSISLPPVNRTLAHHRALFGQLLGGRFGNYDLLYIHGQSLTLRAALALAGPIGRKRLVYHNPDFYCPRDLASHARMEARLCRKADVYINNEFHRGYITHTFYGLRNRLVIAPPNLPKDWPVPAKNDAIRARMAGGRDDAFVLMLHGGYDWRRMVPQLFEALARLDNRFRLVMTGGSAKPDHVDEIAHKLGIRERVVRLPRLSFDDLLAYTVNADAGLLLYEGTLGNFFTAPGRLTEYLTCGLPVLASAYTGIENVVRGFDVGVTANAYDIDRLARGAEILEQQVRSGRFPSAEMKRRFEDHFAFDHWEPLVVSALEDCLHDRKNPDPPNKPYLPWWPGGDAWQSRSSGLV